jgi:molecular chaperone GrpE
MGHTPENPSDESQTPDTLPVGDALVQKLQAEAADYRDRLLRTQAELENFRKRSRRELEDERKYAEMQLVRDMLPVLDNIDRAISAAQKHTDASSLADGFKMVGQQLHRLLESHQVKRIEAEGEPFDPAFHEAILQQPDDSKPQGTVLSVHQTGYQLHDRVVRPAQVIVSTTTSAQ